MQVPQYGDEELAIESSGVSVADADARYMALVRDRLRRAAAASDAAGARGEGSVAGPARRRGDTVAGVDRVRVFDDPWNPKDTGDEHHEYRRAQDIVPFSAHAPLELWSDGSVTASDIRQGALGDCWLLSAMAVLASASAAPTKVLPANSVGGAAAAAAKPVEGGLVKRLFLNASKHTGGCVSFDAQAGVFAVRLYRPDRGTWTRVVLDTSFPVRRRRVGARVAISPDGIVHVVPSDCDAAARKGGESYVAARRAIVKSLGCAESAIRVDESDAHPVAGAESLSDQVTSAVVAAARQLAARLEPLMRQAPSENAGARFEFAVQKA